MLIIYTKNDDLLSPPPQAALCKLPFCFISLQLSFSFSMVYICEDCMWLESGFFVLNFQHLSVEDSAISFSILSCVTWPFYPQKTERISPDLRLSHAPCFPRWAFSQCDRNQDLKCACAGGLALLPLYHCLEKNPTHPPHQVAMSFRLHLRMRHFSQV